MNATLQSIKIYPQSKQSSIAQNLLVISLNPVTQLQKTQSLTPSIRISYQSQQPMNPMPNIGQARHIHNLRKLPTAQSFQVIKVQTESTHPIAENSISDTRHRISYQSQQPMNTAPDTG